MVCDRLYGLLKNCSKDEGFWFVERLSNRSFRVRQSRRAVTNCKKTKEGVQYADKNSLACVIYLDRRYNFERLRV